MQRLQCLAAVLAMVAVPTGGKVIGFTIDDESCSGLGLPYHNVSDQIVACAKYFEELRNWTTLAHSEGLTMSADAGTGWTCPGEPFPPTAHCFNISYGGKNASVAEHVVDLVDTAVLMDYDTTYETVSTRAAPYLYYADSISGKKVVIGVAVVDTTATKQWWQTADEAALEKLMGEVIEKEGAAHPSFAGTAVFTSGSWYDQAAKTPYSGPFHGPAHLWYMDPNVAFNTTVQDSWLSFATSRKITGWYISVHGSRPLIGGNAADEAAFCKLIKRADSLGIDFSFFSSLTLARTQDIPFIKSC